MYSMRNRHHIYTTSGVDLVIIEKDITQYNFMIDRFKAAASGKGPDAVYLGKDVIGNHGIFATKAGDHRLRC